MTKRTPAEIVKQWEELGKVPRRPKYKKSTRRMTMPVVNGKHYAYTKKGKAAAAAAKKGSKKKK